MLNKRTSGILQSLLSTSWTLVASQLTGQCPILVGIDQWNNRLESPFVGEFCEDLSPESCGDGGGGGGGGIVHVEHSRGCHHAGVVSNTFYRHHGLQKFLQDEEISELD